LKRVRQNIEKDVQNIDKYKPKAEPKYNFREANVGGVTVKSDGTVVLPTTPAH